MCVYVRNSMEFYNATVECTRVDDDELADCMVQHTVTLQSEDKTHDFGELYCQFVCSVCLLVCLQFLLY